MVCSFQRVTALVQKSVPRARIYQFYDVDVRRPNIEIFRILIFSEIILKMATNHQISAVEHDFFERAVGHEFECNDIGWLSGE